MSDIVELRDLAVESPVKSGLRPNQRIVGLEQFYTSPTPMSEVVVEEDLKVKKASEEVRGMWVLDQFISNAKILGVFNFIIPIEEGGIDMPEICPIEEYMALFQ